MQYVSRGTGALRNSLKGPAKKAAAVNERFAFNTAVSTGGSGNLGKKTAVNQLSQAGKR
jgi:hypothetical protein